MRPLHVGVMGAGAIGGFVGGCLLASHTAEVTFVGRDSLRRAVADAGLTVRGFGRDDHVAPDRVHVETDVESLATCDVVLVCVKSGATQETARAIAPVLREDAIVVSLQNGVRNPDVLRENLHGQPSFRASWGSTSSSKMVRRSSQADWASDLRGGRHPHRSSLGRCVEGCGPRGGSREPNRA